MINNIQHAHLTEGFVAQAAELDQIRQAENAVLDHKTQQLGGGLQQTLAKRFRDMSPKFTFKTMKK